MSPPGSIWPDSEVPPERCSEAEVVLVGVGGRSIFFVLSIVLGNLTAGQIKKTDEWENLEAAPAVETVTPVEEDVPVTSTKEQSSDVPN